MVDKLTKAVISLSVVIHSLVLLVFVLLSKKQTCGTVDDENETPSAMFCGNNATAEPLVFKNNCSACHFYDKDMNGPALKGVLMRAPYPEWFSDFIRNEDSLITIKEPYTLLLRKRWSHTPWTHAYDYFSENQMQDLKAYCF